MQPNQIRNYRIEFYGGPNDGEILFSREVPKEVYDIATKHITDKGDYEIYVHRYVLHWLNDSQGKYVYQEIVELNG